MAIIITDDDLNAVLYSDGELMPEELCLSTAEVIREAGPWGQGFPEPLFDGKFIIMNQRLVGQRHLKMVLSKVGDGELVDAIAFNVDLDAWPNYSCDEIKIAYRLDVNEFRGLRKPQLMVEYFKLAS